jgi:hypothetical protein
MSNSPNIPLCRSEFLQNFTISLGLFLERSSCQGWFKAEVDTCEHAGELLERLSIWIRTVYRTRVNLTLWEDKTVWISVALLPMENGEKFEMGFYPDFEVLGHDRIVEALVETVSISTRLCYDESPESLMRQIWKYTGEIKTEGVL